MYKFLVENFKIYKGNECKVFPKGEVVDLSELLNTANIESLVKEGVIEPVKIKEKAIKE